MTNDEGYQSFESGNVGSCAPGLAAGKRVAASAPWTGWREPVDQPPIFVQFNRPQSAAAKRLTAIDPDEQAIQFMTEHAELVRLRDPFQWRGRRKDMIPSGLTA